MTYYDNKETKGVLSMKKWDDLVDYLQDKNLVGSDALCKYCAKNEIKKDNEKKCNTLLWVLAIIGAVAAIAAIAYAVYRYMIPDYLDDFDFDDFEDEDFEEEYDDDLEDEIVEDIVTETEAGVVSEQVFVSKTDSTVNAKIINGETGKELALKNLKEGDNIVATGSYTNGAFVAKTVVVTPQSK